MHRKSTTIKSYLVTITTTGYTYNTPEEIEFFATSNAAAVKQARAMMRNNGHTRHDGTVTYHSRRNPDA